MTVSLIISTYNKPAWLEKTLWAVFSQTLMPDEIIIADDGSSEETRDLIKKMSNERPIVHIWHEDNGFKKCEILNKAIVAAKSEYLIFIDQDCVMRPDFIATHLHYAKPNHFLSGGVYRLNKAASTALTRKDIESEAAFNISHLNSLGQKDCSFKQIKLLVRRPWDFLLNALTTTKATWNGGSSSTWREYIIQVNGYNEDMEYGGEDRELGERMINMGIKGKQIRYSAIILHLEHGRPYKNKETMEKNQNIRQNTIGRRIIVTPNGINKLK